MSLYKDASLVMIPSAVKDGKLYSIRPTDGDGDFTFSRGSNLAATRVDVNGLIEKGRENRLTYSQDYTQSSWNKSNCTITSNYIANPVDGSVNAPNITIEQTSGSYEKTMTQQNLTFVAGNVYCVSVWMKAGSISSDTLKILAYDGGQVYSSPLIYLDDIDNTPCEYEAGNDGWNRFYFYFKANNSGLGYIYIFNYAFGQVSNAGTNLYIYGAQWELGTYPTDYIETGASTAQAGILEDLPRLDYSGGASCPSLLLEPQRTNECRESEYFGGNYTRSNVNAVLGFSSPEGLNNAYEISPTASGAGVYDVAIYAARSGQPTSVKTSSFFVKPNGQRWIYLVPPTGGSSAVFFDLENGVKGTEKGVSTGTIETHSNGWYRLSLTEDANIGYSYFGVGFCDGDNDFTYTQSSNSIFLYGGQYELGSYPTSYIPTYGSAVTRSEDSAANADISSLYVQNGSTLFFEIECDGEVDELNVTNILRLGTSINTSRVGFLQGYNRIYTTWYDGNTNAFGNLSTLDAGSRVKIAVQLANDGIGRINGGVNGIGNTIKDYTLSSENYTRLEIYRSSRFKQLMIFPTLLTASEMEALTTL